MSRRGPQTHEKSCEAEHSRLNHDLARVLQIKSSFVDMIKEDAAGDGVHLLLVSMVTLTVSL